MTVLGTGPMLRFIVIAISMALTGVLSTGPASAQISLIRDAEIERHIRDLATPIFSMAGVSGSSVDIYLVQDDRLNAFVAGGQNLFLNTGLLERTETPEQLAGVVAHETGHIAGGHLIALSRAQDRAAAESILAALLGVAASVAAGGEVGQAIIAGGAQVAQRNLLSFSRGQEQSADQAAVRYLDGTGMGAAGLMEFFEVLEQNQLLSASRLDPYLLTHPLTGDRVRFVERHVNQHPQSRPPSSAVQEQHARMVAKLIGFLQPPTRALREFEGRDDIAAQYGRAVATYKLGDAPDALRQMEALIAQEPDNPFFHELKGQILFETGKVAEAVPPYAKAVALAPREPLLRFGLARARLANGSTADIEQAALDLRTVVAEEPRNSAAWRTLGIAEGRVGRLGLSNLALAESAVLNGNLRDAKLYLSRADEHLPAGGTARQKLRDLNNFVVQQSG